MGKVVFDNPEFDSWLTAKSREIRAKLAQEDITTREILILFLKAQTNHYHQVEEEFRNEFRSIKMEFNKKHRRFEIK